jgi:hypothetical protein
MRRFEFWFNDREAISWTFDRHPEIGEEIVLGDGGVFRVTGVREGRKLDASVDVQYTCERVRDTTHEDTKAMLARGVNMLPPLPRG